MRMFSHGCVSFSAFIWGCGFDTALGGVWDTGGDDKDLMHGWVALHRNTFAVCTTT